MKRLLAILLCLAARGFSERPQVYVQWSRNHPQGFELVSAWVKLPVKADPTFPNPGMLDDKPGLVSAIKVGNRLIYGCDHYAVNQKHYSVVTYCWRDGREVEYSRVWYGNSSAEVCQDTMRKTTCTAYGPFGSTSSEIEFYKPFSAFKKPSDKLVRHGITMPAPLWSQHKELWTR